MSGWTVAGKILAVLGIGTVIVAQALPADTAWKSFGNALGVAFTAMSAFLIHNGNGQTKVSQ